MAANIPRACSQEGDPDLDQASKSGLYSFLPCCVTLGGLLNLSEP